MWRLEQDHAVFVNRFSQEKFVKQNTALGRKIQLAFKVPRSREKPVLVCGVAMGLLPVPLHLLCTVILRYILTLLWSALEKIPCLVLWQSLGADVDGDRLVPEPRPQMRGSLSDWQDNFKGRERKGSAGSHFPLRFARVRLTRSYMQSQQPAQMRSIETAFSLLQL